MNADATEIFVARRQLGVLAPLFPDRLAVRTADRAPGPAIKFRRQSLFDRPVVRQRQIPDAIEPAARGAPKCPEGGVFVSVDGGRAAGPTSERHGQIVGHEDRVVRLERHSGARQQAAGGARRKLDHRLAVQLRRWNVLQNAIVHHRPSGGRAPGELAPPAGSIEGHAGEESRQRPISGQALRQAKRKRCDVRVTDENAFHLAWPTSAREPISKHNLRRRNW